MNLEQVVEKACQAPTLVDALTWICAWESERVVKQATENLGSGTNGAGWDTCFKACISRVMTEYGKEPQTGTEKPRAGIVPTTYPPPHERCVLWRKGDVYTATPCYGMHEPWWVVKTLDGEALPAAMRSGDAWYSAEGSKT